MNAESHNFKQLKREILQLSISAEWEAARLEWQLSHIFDNDEPETCLCSHFPIIEICVLINIKNGNSAEVGNVCVKRFLGIRSDRVFSCVKRVRGDLTKAPNAETIELLYQQRLISAWEREFSFDTLRKRLLTARQIAKRKEINQKILSNIVRARV